VINYANPNGKVRLVQIRVTKTGQKANGVQMIRKVEMERFAVIKASIGNPNMAEFWR